MPEGGIEAAPFALGLAVFGGEDDAASIPPGCLLLLDIARAFPTLRHSWILDMMQASACPAWLVQAVRAQLAGQRARFKLKHVVGRWHPILQGVRQGDP